MAGSVLLSGGRRSARVQWRQSSPAIEAEQIDACIAAKTRAGLSAKTISNQLGLLSAELPLHALRAEHRCL
jgi:hypothetical protein